MGCHFSWAIQWWEWESLSQTCLNFIRSNAQSYGCDINSYFLEMLALIFLFVPYSITWSFSTWNNEMQEGILMSQISRRAEVTDFYSFVAPGINRFRFQGPAHYLSHQSRKRRGIWVHSAFQNKYEIDFSGVHIQEETAFRLGGGRIILDIRMHCQMCHLLTTRGKCVRVVDMCRYKRW